MTLPSLPSCCGRAPNADFACRDDRPGRYQGQAVYRSDITKWFAAAARLLTMLRKTASARANPIARLSSGDCA
ncbi:hypothetical protein BGLA2_2320018 [Burkholderia gladioli]|nr:hypothetical protein BGLA2_2320018 [Burkholderia gladioli]